MEGELFLWFLQQIISKRLLKRAMNQSDLIDFEGKTYRKDIGFDL